MQTSTAPRLEAGKTDLKARHTARSPRPLQVLVADDDPASRRFLVDAVCALGAMAQSAIDGPAALDTARVGCYDLLILDCHMPGMGALEVLATLRADTEAPSADTVAVASSAQFEAAQRNQLLAAGFSELLLKPCTLADLRRVLALGAPATCAVPLLDDEAAIKVGGDSSTMLALRRLLRDELAMMHRELDRLSANPEAFSDRLHRLRSSCGFCGAAALARQVSVLQRDLQLSGVSSQASLQRFGKVLINTLDALDPPPR